MKEIRLCDDCNIELTADVCRRYGFGVEVQGLYNPYIKDPQTVLQTYKNILPSLGGGRSLHAPFWDLNLGSKMQGIKTTTREMFEYAYRYAKELNCTEIIVHNGYIPGTSPYSKWVERASVFWKEFFQEKDDSIIMCIENQFETDSEILKMEIDAVNDPRLKICLDTGHAHANSRMSVEEWIISLKDRIHYLHLHNNHGKQNLKNHNDDEHLPLNRGTIPMRTVLEQLERYAPDAIWSIETNPKTFEESVSYLKTVGLLTLSQKYGIHSPNI